MVRSEGNLRAIHYTSRPALLLLLACSAGLVVWSLFDGYVGIFILLGLSLVSLTLGIVFRRKYNTFVSFGLVGLFGTCFGLYSDTRYVTARSLPVGDTLYDTEVIIQHPVASGANSPRRYTAKVKYHGREVKVLLTAPTNTVIPKVMVYGGRIFATIDIQSLTEDGDIPDNSYYKYLLSEGYHARGTLQEISRTLSEKQLTLDDRMKLARSKVVERFESSSQSKLLTDTQRGFLYALTLGERAYLSSDVKDNFQYSGLAHILAVSGYHLGVIYFILSWILSLILPYYRHRRIRYIILLMGITIYALICGASAATMRAMLMSTIIIIGKMLDRPSDPIQVLSLTAVIILFVQPLSFLNAGVMLSLSAVWGILVFMPLFQKLIQPSNKILRYIGNILFVCISAQFGVMPFLFYYFNQAVFSILWSNIPAVLLSAVLIPFGLLVMIISLIVSPPIFLIKLLGWLIEMMNDVVHFFSSWSNDLTLSADYDVVMVVMYYLILHCIYLLSVRYINSSQKKMKY